MKNYNIAKKKVTLEKIFMKNYNIAKKNRAKKANILIQILKIYSHIVALRNNLVEELIKMKKWMLDNFKMIKSAKFQNLTIKNKL